ncbi:MAG: hypothetical protein C4527_01535 [Candidatus Omnitrophota bacterium]|jgi:hypothetical protein|nr:MAG: hypothetical protein C4527_01535 [Candidatus Omnitrophota bacterium]
MMTNTEIKVKGLQVLTKSLGLVEAERFVALIQQEPFDYTKWRDGLFEDLTVEEISQKAMDLRMKKAEQDISPDKGMASDVT